MKTYLFALITVVLLFVGHIIGGEYNLYRHLHGYDIFMHILGGLGIGFSITAVLGSCIDFFELKKRDALRMQLHHNYWIIIVLVFIGGFLWELFEAYYNIAGAPVGTKAYYIDTLKDLVDDMIGGCVAVYVWRRR
jgi:hypothetical protein